MGMTQNRNIPFVACFFLTSFCLVIDTLFYSNFIATNWVLLRCFGYAKSVAIKEDQIWCFFCSHIEYSQGSSGMSILLLQTRKMWLQSYWEEVQGLICFHLPKGRLHLLFQLEDAIR